MQRNYTPNSSTINCKDSNSFLFSTNFKFWNPAKHQLLLFKELKSWIYEFIYKPHKKPQEIMGDCAGK